jgi:hypothetical protein
MSLATLVPKTREETFMADDNDKILPVIRLLLAAFLGLLFVLVLQLFFLVSRANAATHGQYSCRLPATEWRII